MTSKRNARKGKTIPATPATPEAPSADLSMVPASVPTLADGTPILGLQDFGAKAASRIDSALSSIFMLAQYANEHIPGFPDNAKDDANRLAIYAGFIQNYNLITPATRYLREGEDTYTAIESGQTVPPTREVVTLSVGYATSYSAQSFGALRQKQPNLHALIKRVRDNASKYCNKYWSKLVAAHAELYATKEGRTRAPNAGAREGAAKAFEAVIRKNKYGLAHQDDTAIGVAQLEQLIAAFLTGWDKAVADRLKAAKSAK